MALTLNEARNQADALKNDVVKLSDALDWAVSADEIGDFVGNVEEALAKANDLASELKKIYDAKIINEDV